MPDTAIAQRANAASKANRPRCVFFCEYVARDRIWKWTWKATADEIGEPVATRDFATLNDCLQDAARHGFGRDHISIRYSARQPALSLFEKFDDRSKEFIRALKSLIPAVTPKPRPGTAGHFETWHEGERQDGSTWQFSGSPHVASGELSGRNEVR